MEKVKKYRILYRVFLVLGILTTLILCVYLFILAVGENMFLAERNPDSLFLQEVLVMTFFLATVIFWTGFFCFFYFHKKYKAAQREALNPKP